MGAPTVFSFVHGLEQSATVSTSVGLAAYETPTWDI